MKEEIGRITEMIDNLDLGSEQDDTLSEQQEGIEEVNEES